MLRVQVQQLLRRQGTGIGRVSAPLLLLVEEGGRHHWVTPWHRHVEPQLEIRVFAVLSEEVHEIEVTVRVELSEVEQGPERLLLPFVLFRLSAFLKLLVRLRLPLEVVIVQVLEAKRLQINLFLIGCGATCLRLRPCLNQVLRVLLALRVQ